MKRFFSYTLISLLAGLIFYGGAGVNWVTYCCDNCLKTGIHLSVVNNCCGYMQEDERTQGIPALSASESAISGVHNCGIERVEFEWTSLEDQNLPIIQPFVTGIIPNLFNTHLPADSEQSIAVSFQGGDPPAVLLPRAYLALLTVLLI